VWFALGAQGLHIGIEEPFAPARKAHPALRVTAAHLDVLAARIHAASGVVIWADDLRSDRCFYSEDPWGNRLEVLAQPLRDGGTADHGGEDSS